MASLKRESRPTKGISTLPVVINCLDAYAQFVAKMARIEIPNWGRRHEILITEPVDPGVCPPMLMSFSGSIISSSGTLGGIICGMGPGTRRILRIRLRGSFSSRCLRPSFVSFRAQRECAWFATGRAVRYDARCAADHRETDVNNFYHSTRVFRAWFNSSPVAGRFWRSIWSGRRRILIFRSSTIAVLPEAS